MVYYYTVLLITWLGFGAVHGTSISVLEPVTSFYADNSTYVTSHTHTCRRPRDCWIPYATPVASKVFVLIKCAQEFTIRKSARLVKSNDSTGIYVYYIKDSQRSSLLSFSSQAGKAIFTFFFGSLYADVRVYLLFLGWWGSLHSSFSIGSQQRSSDLYVEWWHRERAR